MENEVKLFSNSFDQISRFNSRTIFLKEFVQQPSDRFYSNFYKYHKHFLGPGIFILKFFKHLRLSLCLVKNFYRSVVYVAYKFFKVSDDGDPEQKICVRTF